jgi:hypothetical protein
MSSARPVEKIGAAHKSGHKLPSGAGYYTDFLLVAGQKSSSMQWLGVFQQAEQN